MIRFVQILLLLSLMHSNAAHSTCETLQLPFEPYSSTYLPSVNGRLTNIYKDADPMYQSPRPEIAMTPEQLNSWSNLTLMQKLDSLNEYILSKKTNHQEKVHKSHFIKDAPGWWGYCDQWASAALDPEVNAFINSSPDATICGNLVITKGDIKEMFTGFYPARGRHSGTPLLHRLNNAEEWALQDSSGDDLYSAKSFDQDVRSSLKDGQGLVLNTTKAGEVWNFPVFRSERCEEKLAMNPDTVGQLEPCLLESKDRDVNLWLHDLCDTDHLALKRVHDYSLEDKPPDYSANARALATQVQILNSKLQMRKTKPEFAARVAKADEYVSSLEDSMGRARFGSRSLIKDLATADAIQAKDLGLQVFRVKNKITTGVETRAFAANHNVKHEWEPYSYLLVKNSKGEIIASKWETIPNKRPGYATVPFRNERQGWGQPLRDLVEVLDRCREFPEFRTQNLESLKMIHETIQGAAVPM